MGTLIGYQIDPADTELFLAALRALAVSRQRNGGYAWGIYERHGKARSLCRAILLAVGASETHERTTLADKAQTRTIRFRNPRGFHTWLRRERTSLR